MLWLCGVGRAGGHLQTRGTEQKRHYSCCLFARICHDVVYGIAVKCVRVCWFYVYLCVCVYVCVYVCVVHTRPILICNVTHAVIHIYIYISVCVFLLFSS